MPIHDLTGCGNRFVERASDIRAVLSLKRDYPQVRLVLVGVAEGWLVAREIAAARVPVRLAC